MLTFGEYARKSDDDRSVTEKSITEQIGELQPIIDREGLTVARVWEESKSAKIPGVRPLYSEMIDLIEKGEINAIICWHINRLVRNMEEGGKLVQLFVDGNIREIRTISGTYRTGDNILPLVIEAASATQFSLDHARNVHRGMKGKFEKGGWNHKAPQGYTNARSPINLKVGIVVKDPQRYDLIRKAWDMFLTGAYTPPQVMRTLTDVWGYRTRQTKKVPSRRLNEGFGYKLFSNPFYAGFVREKGQLRRFTEIEPMVTMEEFQRAQELLGRTTNQRPKRHYHPYTGLMTCGYCGRQITAEKRLIAGKVWEQYACGNNRCTKMGMDRTMVECEILDGLARITIDADLCTIALDTILRDLNRQVQPVSALYSTQNSTLEDIENRLNNLAEMWISGLMSDRTTYKAKEDALVAERNKLLITTQQSRDELERMRANAMAAANYVVYARDNFILAPDLRKREIAHALGMSYIFYGREKKIDLSIHPLLLELVRFANSLEVNKIGSPKEKAGDFSPALPFGGTAGKTIEVPSSLSDLLRTSSFRDFGFA